MGIMDDSKETPLSAVRPREMEVSPSGTFDMNESSHLTIGYLLRSEHENLESKPYSWLAKIKN